MTSKIRAYTSFSSVEKWWLDDIAPNYFDMDEVNLYRTGIFGYINEVMATVTEDSWNAINIARREFYPISAQYTQSIYKMAALQELDLPMVSPACCTCILIIPEKDIISKGTLNGDTITYIIDDTLKAPIGSHTFMLDYPIVILAKPNGTKYSYTTHHEIKYKNSIAASTNKYIQHKRIKRNGEYFLLLKVKMQQYVVTNEDETVIRQSVIDTYTADFKINGNLTNFEVFYKESDNSETIQLVKQIDGSNPNTEPFCNYKLTSDNILTIIFPYNTNFMPAYNSTITVRIYTSEGADGNFPSYKDDFACIMESEKYPYNNETIIVGICDGPATGGVDKDDLEAFRQKVIDAYATNKTISTESDLQILFNDRSNNDNNRIVFRKERDDIFQRLFGAFMLLKDEDSQIVPTNTINLNMYPTNFSDYYESAKRFILKPGAIFKYRDKASINNTLGNVNSISARDMALDLSMDLDAFEYGENEDFLFTNPFLISVTKDPNVVGYYLNSINESLPFDFSYVNDNSIMQFIVSNLTISRNAILGNDTYELSLSVSPSSDDVDLSLFYTDANSEETGYELRAKDSGIVQSVLYNNTTECMECTVLYDDGTTESFQYGSIVNCDGTSFNYKTGYKPLFKIYERFQVNDIIARKLCSDTGKMRIILQLNVSKSDNKYYIPFVLESLSEDGSYMNFKAYLPTDDYISLANEMKIVSNVLDVSGIERPNGITTPINGITPSISIFYLDDSQNIPHSYDSYEYVKNYTLTNIYDLMDDHTMTLINPISFIKSTMTYNENDIINHMEEEDTFSELYLHSVPSISDTISNQTLRKNIGSVTLDDTLDWKFNTDMGAYYVEDISTFAPSETSFFHESEIVRCITDKILYPGVSPKDMYLGAYGVVCGYCESYGGLSKRGFSVKVPPSTNITSIDEFKTWIHDNPILVYYQLGDPVSIHIDSNLNINGYSLYDHMVGKMKSVLISSYDNDGSYYIQIKQVPVVKANWLKTENNASYFTNAIKDNYNFICEMFYRLEQTFSIDLKFYNTYGKSKYYFVGIKDASNILDKVNCTFSFGIKLSTLTDEEQFRSDFVNYIKNYIESLNSLTSDNKSTYIMNMVSDAKNNFDEIEYLEYYGMNSYGTDVQKIEAVNTEELIEIGITDYIPEFINIYSVQDGITNRPKIDILFL